MKNHKYKIVYNKISNYMLSGEWAVGSMMKSENELIKLFKVSRVTIRHVLSLLASEGRVEKKRGKKTIIRDQLLTIENEGKMLFNSLTQQVINSGHVPHYKLLEFKLVANPFDKLFSSSTALYYMERVRIFDEKPYLISRAYISKDLCGNLNSNYFDDNNIPAILMKKKLIKFLKSTQNIKPINLSIADASMFGLAKGSPAISLKWFFYDNEKNLVFIDEEIITKPISFERTYVKHIVDF